MPHYRVPYDGSGVSGDPYRMRHADEIEADSDAYRAHHIADTGVVVAAAVELPALEALADDADSAVDRYDPADGEYPAPEYADGGDAADGDGPDDHECEVCGDTFETQRALNGHQTVHR